MKSRRKTFSEINITPLTDIFLVLLVIMMVATPMLDYRGLNLAVLTVGAPPDPKAKPKTIMVEISPQGEYKVGEGSVSREELAATLRRQAPDNPEGVIIETDPNATHEAITFAMAAVESAGITKLALTEKEEKRPETAPPSTPKKRPAKKSQAKKP